MKKHPWQSDEIILLLHIFFHYLTNIIEGCNNNSLNKDLIQLSHHQRTINLHHNNFETNPRYRNVNGMKMMIQNLRYIHFVENNISSPRGLYQYPKYFIPYYRKYYKDINLLENDYYAVLDKYNLD